MTLLPAPLPPDPGPEIEALARRFARANGPVLALISRLGGSVEDNLRRLPDGMRQRLDTAVRAALTRAMDLAAAGDRMPATGPAGATALAVLTGAAGGAGGVATTLAELPVTVTVILHAIRTAAREAGYDPDAPAIRAECLRTFAMGSPLSQDDGVNTGFLGARLTLTGPALHGLIASVAPKLAAALGQKLALQAVPVLGAAAGAAVNAAFLTYYRELARIRFALLRLSETHGVEPVLTAFAAAARPPRITRA